MKLLSGALHLEPLENHDAVLPSFPLGPVDYHGSLSHKNNKNEKQNKNVKVNK